LGPCSRACSTAFAVCGHVARARLIVSTDALRVLLRYLKVTSGATARLYEHRTTASRPAAAACAKLTSTWSGANELPNTPRSTPTQQHPEVRGFTGSAHKRRRTEKRPEEVTTVDIPLDTKWLRSAHTRANGPSSFRARHSRAPHAAAAAGGRWVRQAAMRRHLRYRRRRGKWRRGRLSRHRQRQKRRASLNRGPQ